MRRRPGRGPGLGRPHFPQPEVVGAEPGPGEAMRLLRQRCEAGMFARGLDGDRRAVEQGRNEWRSRD
ncbi:hypothetical protein ABZY34_13370 [Streptomyces virginiae]|uniref:hypothetical protein n=1 Tax=Streptomyces virginiae TaxID=1961 RepID=UPI00339F0E5D